MSTGSLLLDGAGLVDLSTTNSFTGGIALDGGTLDLGASGAAGSGPITFGSAVDPTLEFRAADAPRVAIEDFRLGDVIQINGFSYTGETYVGSTLTLTGVDSAVTLDIPGLTAGDYQISNNTQETVVAGTAPCYATGTRIRTQGGDAPVETLAVGDLVVTQDGTLKPVRWVGHRTVDCTRHPRPEMVWPVCIQADAFGEGIPERNLFLSPDHAVFLEAVLIPIKHLQNGTTVRQIPVKTINYFYVELEQHDVVLAEGLPADISSGSTRAQARQGFLVWVNPVAADDDGPSWTYSAFRSLDRVRSYHRQRG